MIIPYNLKKVRDIKLTETDLIEFEEEVKQKYESGEITAPVHLTKSNEKELMEIFQYIHPEDWVFCGHRNHHHALLFLVHLQCRVDLLLTTIKTLFFLQL